jgi:NADH-quinone oxidoreductase subunit M
MVLTCLLLLPALGGALSWAVSRNRAAARWVALLACGGEFALGLTLWIGHPPSLAPPAFFLEQRVPWIPQFGITYHLALDGLSLLLIVLTGLLGMVAVLASWREIETRVGAFHCALLTVLTGVTGVFLARDLLLFYLFWELMLVPMYFLIGLWGHERRI